MLTFVANYSVEQIENGWIVRHSEAKRSVHVAWRHDIARQIERFMHDDVVARLEAHEALGAEHSEMVAATFPMQRMEG